MIKHLTVRLAWHDNKWNGNVCEDPESNVYCVGSHSLLSARIAKNRDLDIEKKNKEKREMFKKMSEAKKTGKALKLAELLPSKF